MNKFFKPFIALLMSVFMFSCTEEIIPTSTTAPISFSTNYVGNAVSRAYGDIDNFNVTNSAFYVYGESYDGSSYNDASKFIRLFDKQVVEYNGSRWSYSPLKYWDSEKLYTFTGVMPTEIPSQHVEYNDHKVKITNVPLTQMINDYAGNPSGIDYLVSKAADNKKANDGTVLLEFKHILSRFSIYVYTGAANTDVTLTNMHIYLPSGTATYEEKEHTGPISNVVDVTTTKQDGDIWTWNDEFVNKVDGINDTYTDYSLLTYVTPSVTVPYYDGMPTTADAQLMPMEFFMAPIDKTKLAKKEDLQLYMTLKFHVKYSDGIEQDIERSKPILIQDLHSFTQNYKTNLFVKLLAENDVIAFNVTVDDFENESNHWVDQYGYSFNLTRYSQTFDTTADEFINEISGILYDYGNTDEGDSKTKMTYNIKSLTKVGDTTPTAKNLPMVFSKWSTSQNGSYTIDTDNRAKDTPYGKFTVDLDGIDYSTGYYKMIVENSMGDVREYTIYLTKSEKFFMAFTITVNDNDSYTIPFVTYETVTNYWAATVGERLKSGGVPITMEMIDDITAEENKEEYFKYPSNLNIDWGDNSEMTKINKGEICQTDARLTHTYTTAGDYQITVYSDARYSESQIPQISWGQQATQHNPVASVTNGNGYTDRKIKSMDTPVLRIYDEWVHWQTTFGAYALAAGNGAKYDWMVDIVYSWMNSSFTTSVKSSPITAMFHNSSIQHTADNLFIYNTVYAQAADYTFLMCPRLNNIGKGMFDYCSNIVSMISTFDGDGNQITAIPDGLFDYLTSNVYFKQTFVGCPITYIPADLFDKCGSGSVYQSLGIPKP